MPLSPETTREIQTLSTREFDELWSGLERKHRAEVFIARARTDRPLFCRTLLPDLFGREWSPVHLEFFSRPKVGWRGRERPEQIADLAPRKSAKTTLENNADLIHDLCYGLEVCTLVYSTTFADSERLVKAIHHTLKAPEAFPALHATFGPFVVRGTETEFAVFSKLGEPLGSQYAAKSFGGSGRGHLYRSKRPSKVTMDDIVHPQHVLSATQREKDWEFLNKDILKSGDTYTRYRMLNTVQHADDTTSRAMKDPAWVVTKWQALIAWPENLPLWERCRLIWIDLSNPKRNDAAWTFYQEHRAEMDAGAVVLWPQGRPLFDLMKAFWSNPASFYSEDQNTPRNPGTAVFDVDAFVRCLWDGQKLTPMRLEGGVWTPGRPIPLGELDVAIWHDRSKGGAKNDYPATAVVAKDRPGYRYALELDLTREPASGQRARVWKLWERLRAARSIKVGCDDTAQTEVFGGESWQREIEERRRTSRPWSLNLQSFTLSEDKNARISSQEPDTKNGWLQFARSLPSELMDQYRDHPNSAFDDGPDAIERADHMLTEDCPQVDSYGRG